MRVAIVNIGTIVSGYLDEPFVAGDTIVTDGDRIVAVGTASAKVEACDVVIDADGTTAIPGLIDPTCTSRSAISRRDSRRSATWRATCMAG
jgi:enamidase